MVEGKKKRLEIKSAQTEIEEGLISKTIEELTEDHALQKPGWLTKPSHQLAPSREELIRIVEDIRAVLFPGYFGESNFTPETIKYQLGAMLCSIRRRLEDQVSRGFCFGCSDELGICPESDCLGRSKFTTALFVSRLPEIRRLLMTDVQAAYEGDPAAPRIEETIFCYPGVLAVTDYRVAHELYNQGVPLIPRIITEHAHSITGIDIHPGARIGRSFFIDHGTGVVIGETAVIGDRVRLYQGVTLGAKSFPLDANGNPIKGIDRHPVVEDDVIIYAGATILGRVVIGKNSVIGGNVWLTQDVPAGSKISQRQGQISGMNGKEND